MVLLPSFSEILPSFTQVVSLHYPAQSQSKLEWRFRSEEIPFSTPLSRMVETVPSPKIELSKSVDHLAGIADDLANDELFKSVRPQEKQKSNVGKIVARLVKFFLFVTGADVAFARRLEGNSGTDTAKLFLSDGEEWRDGYVPTGKPPKVKHIADGPCELDNKGLPTSFGGNRTDNYNELAEGRKKPDNSSFYDTEELAFLKWIKSEAWIVIRVNAVPKALICVCSDKPDYFTEENIVDLRRYEQFVNAFYRLAELADERNDKVELVEKISGILPLLAQNSILMGFQRAILTLLTCEHGGFGFDRAFVFWMENNHLPALCNMAVGGRSTDWKSTQEDIRSAFGNLREYIEDSLDCPEPANRVGTKDPLYDSVKAKPISYRTEDGGVIGEYFHKPDSRVPKLTDADPWVQRIQNEHPGAFVALNGEYFMFPLHAAFGAANGKPQLLGFVIADSAYDTAPHNSESGPDLMMALHLLSLVSSVWAAREEAESHFNVVSSLDVFRHNAPALGKLIERLEFSCNRIDFTKDQIESIYAVVKQTINNATELTQAINLLVDTRTKQFSNPTKNPESVINRILGERVTAHGDKLTFNGVNTCIDNVSLYIPERVLGSILGVLANNAVSSAQDANPIQPVVKVEVNMERFHPPTAYGRSADFVKICVRNNGPAIKDTIVKNYLFVEGISTHKSGNIPHRGSGLATARLQAQAYGGDLILGSADPVEFELLVMVQKPVERPVQP